MDAAVADRYSPPDILGFLAHAKRGEALEYHRGALSVDCDQHMSRLSEGDREKLKDIRKIAMHMCEKSKAATLVQKRHGPADYSYFIVKK